VVVAWFFAGAEGAAKTLIFVVLPLGCIWFSDVLGDYTGYGLGRVAITKTSPGIFVYYLGWVALLVPLFIGVWLRIALPRSGP